jgi:hypothetical protein
MPKGTGLLVFGLLSLASCIAGSIRGIGSPGAQLLGYAFTAAFLGAAIVDLSVVCLDAHVARHRAIRIRVDD